MKFEWFIAQRYLRGKRRMGFISVITYISVAGVFLGTLVLVVALSIANGFEKEVRDRIIGTFAHARIMRYLGKPVIEYDSLRTTVLEDPEVVGAAPYILGKAGIEHEQVQEGIMVMGIDPLLEETVTNLASIMKSGSFRLDSIRSIHDRLLPGIIIGMQLADKMGVREGSEVTLMSLVRVEGEADPVPRMVRCAVAGVFETGLYENDLTLSYISIASAQNLFQKQGADGVQLRVANLYKAAETAARITKKLGGYPYMSEDWLNQNKSLFQSMKLEKLIIFIVISLIFIVAAFNIISSLIMMILEKRREIGILMGMGGDSHAIMRIFLLNGSVIGFLGSTAGTILGIIICLVQWKWHLIPLPGDIYFIESVPVIVKTLDVVAVYVSANIICLLASWYPSWQASKIIPAESIRYE